MTAEERRLELANSLTHGIGILFGVVAFPILLSTTVIRSNVEVTIAAAVYAFSFLMVFTTSTVYHSSFHEETKKVLRILDHISIYFLIAGTYTPFIIIFSKNGEGDFLLIGLWMLAGLGIIFKVFFTHKFNFISTLIYLLMGWSLVLLPRSFFQNIPPVSWIFIILGGTFYTVGVLFYLWKKMKYHHVIWHLFVLAAGVSHFIAMYLGVLNY